MTRLVVRLDTSRGRAIARRAIDRAPDDYVADIHEGRRSDEQNRALWGLLNQITAQRPTHNGVKMDAELWKCVFMHALGVEMKMLPNLDCDGYFPLGHRSSQLTVSQFSNLLEIMLAWTAREGLIIKHFDGEPPRVGEFIDAEFTEVKLIADGRPPTTGDTAGRAG